MRWLKNLRRLARGSVPSGVFWRSSFRVATGGHPYKRTEYT